MEKYLPAIGRYATQITLTTTGLLVVVVAWAVGIYLLQDRVTLSQMLGPAKALESLIKLAGDNALLSHIAASLRRVSVGLLIALAIGVPLGIAVGVSRRFEAASGGAFQFLRMISPLSWMPIAVMILGVGDAPIYFLLSFAAVWPILLNTAAGVRHLDPSWLQLARSLSATRSEILLHVILPGIVGHILTGVRLAIGILWIVLVPCEMLGVNSGLGYFILDTRDRLAYSELMAAIVIIGAIGFALDAFARQLHTRWIFRS